MDVCKSLSTLKHEKSDGLRGTDSDHFIYNSQLFKIYITLTVNSMFTHGYTPSSLLELVINSIPKDLYDMIWGDMCSKDNYRGIALCSALCKLVNILIIEKHGDVLFTSELQFAFKPRHSTNMCTAVLKEVCSYLNVTILMFTYAPLTLPRHLTEYITVNCSACSETENYRQ